MMTETADRKAAGGVDWDDPSIPAGDSPPLPRWPVWVSALVWGAWIIFLASLAFA